MERLRSIPEFIALSLILALTPPTPAFALRNEATQENSGLEELKQELAAGRPDRAARQLANRLEHLLDLSPPAAGLEEQPKWFTFDSPVTRVSLSMGGARLYGMGPRGGGIKFMDLNRARRSFSIEPKDSGIVTDVAYSGVRAAVIRGSSVNVWSHLPGRSGQTFNYSADTEVVDARFSFPFEGKSPPSPERGSLVIALPHGLDLVNSATGELRLRLELDGGNGPITGASLSADGRWLAVRIGSETVQLFNLSEGKKIFTPFVLHRGEGRISDFTFPPHAVGKVKLAVASGNRVTIWDVETQQKQFELEHEAPVARVVFSADQRVLASATGSPHQVILWEVETGGRLATFPLKAPATDLGFSFNGKRLAAAMGTREVAVWDLPARVRERMTQIGRPFEYPAGWEVHAKATLPEEILAQIGDQPMRWIQKWFDQGVPHGYKPGMGFSDLINWWTLRALRPFPHAGIDFLLRQTPVGGYEPIPAGTEVPALFDGQVVLVFEDTMQSTIVVESDMADREGRKLLMVYTHVKLSEEKKQQWRGQMERGKSIKITASQILGTIDYSRNPDSVVAPHLHLTVALMQETERKRLWGEGKYVDKDVWPELDQMVKEGRLIYLNPLEIFEPEFIDTHFVRLPEEKLEGVLIFHEVEQGAPDPKWANLRKPIVDHFPTLALPGAKSRESVRKTLSNPEKRVDVILVNNEDAKAWILETYGNKYPVILYPGEINQTVLDDLNTFRQAGIRREVSIDLLKMEPELTALLKVNGVDTVGELLELDIAPAELGDPSMAPEMKWALLRARALVAPQTIPLEAILPKTKVLDYPKLFDELGKQTVEFDLHVSVKNLLELLNLYRNEDNADRMAQVLDEEQNGLILRTIRSLLPMAEIPTHTFAVLFVPSMEGALKRLGANLDELIQSVTQEEDLFERTFPDPKDRAKILLALAQIRPSPAAAGLEESASAEARIEADPRATAEEIEELTRSAIHQIVDQLKQSALFVLPSEGQIQSSEGTLWIRPPNARGLGVEHLVENATEAILEEARRQGRIYQGQIRLQVAPEAGGWRVELEDNGAGFSGEALAAIFRRRFSSKEKSSGWTGGNGTALLSVGHVVIGTGGSLEIDTKHWKDGSHWMLYGPKPTEIDLGPGSRETAGTIVRIHWPRLEPPAAGLEEALPVPRFTLRDLEQWVEKSPASSGQLYGWLRQLSPSHQKWVLSTVAQAYRSFGAHMRWAAKEIPRMRKTAVAYRKKDSTWVTQQDIRVQRVFNSLVRRLVWDEKLPGMEVIGEEESLPEADTPWRIVRDPIDGTRGFMKRLGEPDSDHYLSTLTLLYREHPVLTIVVAPEYRLSGAREQGLWLVAGLGIDEVLLNGEQATAPVGRSLRETVGGVGVLRQTIAFNWLYAQILQKHSKRIAVYGDAMPMFELIASGKHPELPGAYLAGAQPLWDAIPPWHLTLALGGAVTDLRGRPVRLTEALLKKGEHARIPARLVAASPAAHRQILREHAERSRRIEKNFQQWLHTREARRFLLPRPSASLRPIRRKELVAQQAARILESYETQRNGRGKYAEAFSGPDLAGHVELAKELADELRRLLNARGRSDVKVALFLEDWYVRSRLERVRWFVAGDPRALLHQDWIRWDDLHRDLDRVWSAQGSVTLGGLYERIDGRTEHEQTLQMGKNSILLVAGTYPLDKSIYDRNHPGLLSFQTIVGVDTWVSFYQHLEASERTPTDLFQLYRQAYLPRWLHLMGKIHLGEPGILALDINNVKFPRVLHYAAGMEEKAAQVGTQGLPAVEVIHPEAIRALNLKGIFWDNDETLWLGYPRDLATRFLAERVGVNTQDTQEMERFYDLFKQATGLHWEALMEQIHQAGWIPPPDLQEAPYLEQLNKAFWEEIRAKGLTNPDNYLTPGGKELLSALQGSGIRMAIVTGGDTESRDQVLQELGIRDFFEKVHGGGKKLDAILQQTAEWGFNPNQLAFIGDGVGDVKAARRAGIIAIGFARTPEDRETFSRLPQEHQPDAIINRDFRAGDEILNVLHLRQSGLEESEEKILTDLKVLKGQFEEIEMGVYGGQEPSVTQWRLTLQLGRVIDQLERGNLWDSVDLMRPLVLAAEAAAEDEEDKAAQIYLTRTQGLREKMPAFMQRIERLQNPPAVGLKEKVVELDAEGFVGKYWGALESLKERNPQQRLRMLEWVGRDGARARAIDLPDRVTLYVSGRELFEQVRRFLKLPEGIHLEVKMLPLSPRERWDKIGLILNDIGVGEYRGQNPYRLPVHNMYLIDAWDPQKLNAAFLLAEIFASLPVGSYYLGAELITDAQGRAQLVLFSAA